MAGEAAQSPPQRGRGQEHLAVHGWLPVGRPEYGVLERVVEQGRGQLHQPHLLQQRGHGRGPGPRGVGTVDAEFPRVVLHVAADPPGRLEQRPVLALQGQGDLHEEVPAPGSGHQVVDECHVSQRSSSRG